MKSRTIQLLSLACLGLLVSAGPVSGQDQANGSAAGQSTQKQSPRISTPAFNSFDARPVLDLFNGRPVPPNAYRVLFIGDSLTIHPRIPNLWDVWSGMAASSPSLDFVHLAAIHMQGKLGTVPVEIFYDNGGNGKIPTMLTYLQRHPELVPSLVVLQGGENDKFGDDFQRVYRTLLDFYPRSAVTVIVLSDFFNTEKRDFEQKEAMKRGLLFIDINTIFKNPAMTGDAGPYNVPGVARHPNTKGMRAIADAIDDQFDKCVLPKLKHQKSRR